ncbi:MAG: Hsp20/alpha crystallin family protein [Acidobacteria bacterium]|nr:Hsp20/alpha crystallin family protein [Acidobacteriota bacterium]MDW7983731.1 Hsp20/alpha crystallin family protein [Acidobacteriota bacterium]
MWKHDLRDTLRVLYGRFNRLLEETLSRELEGLAVDPDVESPWEPPVDLYETPEGYVIEAEIAGVDRANLEVRVEGHQVWILGTRTLAPVQEGQEYYRIEIPAGPLARCVPLPETADPDRLETTYRDGLLTVWIPRRSAAVREVSIE